jgi:3-hydroxy-9,10-secoandrosta-1,3,5(10)-triene-9,17-dione monooxygenase
MSASKLTESVQAGSVPSSEELIMRATAMRPLLRKQADEAELLGHYVPEVHEAMVEAGFYHLLAPHRYGGFELDIPSYTKLLIELARGDPGSAWCFALGHGHVLTTCAYWPAEVHKEIFNNPKGYFRASHSLPPGVTGKRVEGGYILNGKATYQSGAPYSTYTCFNVAIEGENGAPTEQVQVLVPIDQVTVLDDWGKGRPNESLGMRSSGSCSVLVENQFVPARYGAESNLLETEEHLSSFGTREYGNPIYLGAWQSFTKLYLVCTILGAAWAAIDEYEEICKARPSIIPPNVMRYQHPVNQLHIGQAKMMADAADAIAIRAAQLYTEWSTDAVERGIPYDQKKDTHVFGMLVQAGKLASEAVELLFRSGGTAAARDGQRMQRYMRDVQIYRTHVAAQVDAHAMRIGAMYFGEASSIMGAPKIAA